MKHNHFTMELRQFFIVLALCGIVFNSGESDTEWVPKSESTTVRLVAHYFPTERKEYCLVMFALSNAIAGNVAGNTTTELLHFSFRNGSQPTKTNINVTSTNTFIEQFGVKRNYGRLHLDRVGNFNRYQYLAYNVYDNFTSIQVKLPTFPKTPLITIENDDKYFCVKNAYNLTSNAVRLFKKYNHIQTQLVDAKAVLVGKEMNLLLIFYNNEHEIKNGYVENAFSGLKHVPFKLIYSRQVFIGILNVPSNVTEWSTRYIIENEANERILTYEVSLNDTVFIAYESTKQNALVTTFQTTLRENYQEPYGGSITILLPTLASEKNLLLMFASFPNEVGNINANLSIEATKECAVISSTSFACIIYPVVDSIIVTTTKSVVTFNTTERKALKLVAFNDSVPGHYVKKVIVTPLFSDDDYEDYGFKCLLSEEDFVGVKNGEDSVQSSQTLTGQGVEGSFRITSGDCNGTCKQNIGALCVGTFGHVIAKPQKSAITDTFIRD